MPRKPCLHFPGAVYHVILRGNAGEKIFFDDADRYRFYLFLQHVVERFGCRVHGFCLMTNHVHLVMQVGDIPLPVIMQNLSHRYTKWINYSRSRTGHVFQGRYKALLIDVDAYLVQLVRYVHLNPVRAKMVAAPDSYRWSGHRAYLGSEIVPWLTTDWMLSLLDSDEPRAREAYLRFVSDGLREEKRLEFHSGTCEGRILGNDTFVDTAFSRANQVPERKGTLDEVLKVACRRTGTREEEIATAGKERTSSRARALAAILVREAPHLTLAELAKVCRRGESAMGKAAERLLSQAAGDNATAAMIDAARQDLHKCPNV